ncbi:MAG: ATP-binding cassette domain-containing protein [Planctomycetaceae bacterium]
MTTDEVAPTNSDSVSTEVEAASWLVEQLGIEGDQSADRSRIRRSCEEAATAWPGKPELLWWRWMVEATKSLGQQCRTVDCTLEQVREIAREGGRLIIRVDSTGQWFAVEGGKSRKLLLMTPFSDKGRQWVTISRLGELLKVTGSSGVIRCVILEPQVQGGHGASDHGKVGGHGHEAEHPSPLSRAWGLLKPEVGDIWVVILFALVAGLLAMATPLAIEALVSTVTFGRLLQPVVVLSLMLLAFLAFQAAIRGLQTYVVEIIQRRLFARVAADVAYRLPRAQYDSLHGSSGRELVNRFFDVVTVQKISSQMLLDGISVVLNTLIGMLVLGFYHPWLLGFDVVLLGLIAFAILVLGRGAIDSSIKESKCKYRMAAWLEDLAGCVIAFRHDGAAEFALERTDRLTYEYLAARRSHFRILMRQILFALGVQAIASTVLLGLGGWLVIDGQLTLGQLVAAELIVTVIVGSFAKLGKHMEGYYDLMASVDKLGYLFDLPVEKQDGLLSFPVEQSASVAITNLEYSYPDGRGVFVGLNLSIPSGARAMLSARSGSGKSVLLDLLYGLRRPNRGHVMISGTDPRELRPDILRRAVVLVRDIEVFEGSLAENVHLERTEVSTADVRNALESVGLLDDVLALPEGLDIPLTPTGYPLTPNQLRKLMLARGIAGSPALLMIDGVLDSLPDQESSEILKTLSMPDQPWTLLVVTGREALAEAGTTRLHLSPPTRNDSQATQETTHG